MAHEEAVVIVNDIHDQLAALARSIVTALNDNKISGLEGMMVGMRGMQVATAIMTIIRDAHPDIRQDILYVLEHGEWVVPGIANAES
jgi:hypothetical protein